MKTNTDRWQFEFENHAARPASAQNSKFKIQNHRAFTLVELLAVIAIIGILAAMLLPVGVLVKKTAYINKTKAEMELVKTAIERYRDTYGFYPPSNPNSALNNQLYYELIGTTNNGVNYVALDGSAQIPVASVNTAFGTGGFMNCNSANKSREDSRMAQSFLSNLKPQQIATNAVNGVPNVALLVGSVGGPDAKYMPLGSVDVNPWRYNSSNPTNNPGAYDLYIQLMINGKTYLICNWSKDEKINSPLP